MIYKGVTEIEFQFPLESGDSYTFYETYHGLLINIKYLLNCEVVPRLSTESYKNSIEVVMVNYV